MFGILSIHLQLRDVYKWVTLFEVGNVSVNYMYLQNVEDNYQLVSQSQIVQEQMTRAIIYAAMQFCHFPKLV